MRLLLMKGFIPPVIALCAALPLAAQELIVPKPGESVPTFEVATVRKADEGAQRMMMRPMGDNYQMENIPLRRIILNAYGLTSDAQLIGSDSLLEQSFDIHAKADADEAAKIQALPEKTADMRPGSWCNRCWPTGSISRCTSRSENFRFTRWSWRRAAQGSRHRRSHPKLPTLPPPRLRRPHRMSHCIDPRGAA